MYATGNPLAILSAFADGVDPWVNSRKTGTANRRSECRQLTNPAFLPVFYQFGFSGEVLKASNDLPFVRYLIDLF